jgi:hypothetical protein
MQAAIRNEGIPRAGVRRIDQSIGHVVLGRFLGMQWSASRSNTGKVFRIVKYTGEGQIEAQRQLVSALNLGSKTSTLPRTMSAKCQKKTLVDEKAKALTSW